MLKALTNKLIPVFTLIAPAVVNGQYSDTANYMVSLGSNGSINKTNDGVAYLFNNALKFGVRRKALH